MGSNTTNNASTIDCEPLATPVTYTHGWLGRNLRGTLRFDGMGTVSLISQEGDTVFSKTTATLGKVRRAENALYFRIDGEMIGVVVGNSFSYVRNSGSLMRLGVAGTVMSEKYASHHTKKSGLDAWEAVLKSTGNLGFNASAKNITKYLFYYPMIALAVIFTLAMVVKLAAS